MQNFVQAVLVPAALLAVAGAAGTLARVGGIALVTRFLGDALPWGTLAVNVAGSFACGAMHSFARSRGLAAGTEAVLIAGLLGGFTTYASFALQSADMLAAGRVAVALAYVTATLLLGLTAAWAGLRCCG
jgi:CrcB protein